jgi:pyruvyl transferase EpsO
MLESNFSSERLIHRGVMMQLKRQLSRITTIMPPDRPVVYLDYPVHNNVGDLLIHQGADAFLADYSYRVIGRFSMHDFSRRGRGQEPMVVLKPSIRDLDALLDNPRCVLVLHGGGNLGDVWPQFQMFREMIIERYPRTRIVVFPQSIHFGSSAARDRAARILGAHRELYVFVRDAESLRFVTSECGAQGELIPDMAHQLWGKPEFTTTSERECGTLVLRRRDRESRGGEDPDTAYFDWGDLQSSASYYLLRALRKWQSIDNPLRHWVPNYRLWRPYRDYLVRRAVARVQPFACVDTDRLHGIILGALLQKRVCYGEGTYGKLNRYARIWFAKSPLIEIAQARHAAE